MNGFPPGEVGFVLCVVRPRPCGVSKSIRASARGVSGPRFEGSCNRRSCSFHMFASIGERRGRLRAVRSSAR